MKTLYKWLMRLLVLLMLLALALLILADVLAKSFLERELERRTGLKVTIGQMHVDLFNARFSLQKVIAYNPAEFAGAPMVQLDELYAECRWRNLLARRLRFDFLRINLSELHAVEGMDGRWNFQAVNAHMKLESARVNPSGKAASSFEFAGVENLDLTVRRVRSSSLRNPSMSGDFDLGIEHEMIGEINKIGDIPVMLYPVATAKGFGLLWYNWFLRK